MRIFVATVLIGLLALGLLGCRLMPWEIGAQLVPKSLTRFLYGGPPSPRKK